MGVFEQFPYSNFHELNADWLIKELLKLKTSVEQFVAINALKYADPIQWNITRQYEKNTIVIDPLTGTAYISVQPVPSGVALTRTEYWTVVFDLGSFVVRAAKNFTDKFEEDTTLTATFPSSVNDWLIWGDTLYRVISNIVAGDQYVIGSNIQHFTIEDVIGHLEDLTTEDKSNIVAAINEVITIIGSLTDLTTEDNSDIVAAINELVSKISTIKDFIGDETLTTTAQTLSGAINELDPIVKKNDEMLGWWKVKSIFNFGLYHTFDDIRTASKYPEDATYDSKRNRLLIAFSDASIMAIDPSTFEIIDEYNYDFGDGSINSIDYNSELDVIYATTVSKKQIIDAATMLLLTTLIGGSRMLYDSVNNQIVSYQGSSNTMTIRKYDNSYNVTETITIPYETYGGSTEITQGGCCKDGIIYTSNRLAIFQFDYINQRVHSFPADNTKTFQQETEGYYFIGDKLFAICNQNTGTLLDYSVNIFVYGDIVQDNMYTVYSMTRENTYHPLYYGGIGIPADSNLNSYIATGNYYVDRDAVAATLLNMPDGVTRAFKLAVKRSHGVGNAYVQEMYVGYTHYKYERNFTISDNVGTFGDWIKVQSNLTHDEAQLNYRFTKVRLAGNASVTCRIAGDLTPNTQAIAYSSRELSGAIYGIDYYGNAPIEMVNIGSYGRLTITKEANSAIFTLTNNVSSSTDVLLFGAKPTT